MQRAEHLLGKCGGDRGLRLTALLQERRQPPIGRVGKEAERVEEELEPAQHWPAGDGAEGPQRKFQMAGSLAAWGINEAQLWQIAILALPGFVFFGDEHS